MRKKRRKLNVFDEMFTNNIFNSNLSENYAQRKKINLIIRIKKKKKE